MRAPGAFIRVKDGISLDKPVEIAWARTNVYERKLRTQWVAARKHLEQLDVALLDSDDGSGVNALLPSVTDPLFPEIAGLAQVPPEGFLRLQQGIFLEMEREWQWHRAQSTIADRKAAKSGRSQVKRLMRLSSDLSAYLRDLNSHALGYLADASVSLDLDRLTDEGLPPPGGYEIDQITKMVAALADRASRAVRMTRPKPSLDVVGRPPRGGLGEPIRQGSLKQFTLRLLWDVRAAGGRLTLNKNSGTGTLPKTLSLLAPHLPPGFVPNVLPLSTLASIKALDKKLATAGLDNLHF
jgi:hypothetical protein